MKYNISFRKYQIPFINLIYLCQKGYFYKDYIKIITLYLLSVENPKLIVIK